MSKIDLKEGSAILKHFKEWFKNAMDFSMENKTFRGITISKDCYEAIIETPIDILYMCFKKVTNNPMPNLLLIQNPTEAEKEQISHDQIEFRTWWRKTCDYSKNGYTSMDIISCDDEHIEFKVTASDDSGILHILMKKYNSIEEFNKSPFV